METPGPVRSHDPGSPLGYRVVEVADEHGTASKSREPWSPVGYEVVPVFEEGTSDGYVAPEPEPSRRRFAHPGLTGDEPFALGRRSAVLAALLTAGAICVIPVALALAAIAHSNRSDRPTRSDVAWGERMDVRPELDNVPLGPAGRCRAAVEVQIPEVEAPAAPEKVEPPPAVANDDARPDRAGERPAPRETFGTAVEFVRNPQEAARSAARERKLAFLLHVSGNFEDDRFT